MGALNTVLMFTPDLTPRIGSGGPSKRELQIKKILDRDILDHSLVYSTCNTFGNSSHLFNTFLVVMLGDYLLSKANANS